MKVCIGSVGRFHSFDLARQIERLGYLRRVYTGYPKWKVDGLPRDKVRAFPWLMGPMMLLGRCGLHNVQELLNLNRLTTESFDRWMAARLDPCDVFHCLSSFGLMSHRMAKERYGALTVCDRGSSHIVSQDEILAEEYGLWGLSYRPIDQRIVERELQEYAECDIVFVPSSFAYSTFLGKGVPAEKVVKMPLGVDLKLFKPVQKEDDVFRVIYVGTMSLRKGIPYLLEGLASLNLPNFELWLIGSLYREIRPFMARYEGRYRYFGIIPRTELYKYYSQASVFLLPSVEDGFGLVMAQAMACGLPVIATTNTGAEDLFTDGVEGFIVPIRSQEAIREKVLYLYKHPEIRDEMSRAAMKRVQSLGGWNSYGERVVASYGVTLAHRQRV